jgi:polysaccharide export outer membrane protein
MTMTFAPIMIFLAAGFVLQIPARPPAANAPAPVREAEAPMGAAVPAGYLIGPEDVLSIVFWRDQDLSAEVSVRPDGRISLPLLNDVQASGLTPEQLRESLREAAARYVEEPTVSVVVKQVNSRKVFITGQVAKPGSYPLSGRTSILQLIAMAGGLLEYADAKNIVVMREENGRVATYKFNYKDVSRGRHLEQNIELQPRDTVIVR